MARARRYCLWTVQDTGDGEFAVLRNGRQLAQGLSGQAVVRYLRKHRKKNDRLQREGPDGYRTPARLSDLLEERAKG